MMRTHIVGVKSPPDTGNNEVLTTSFIITNTQRNRITHKPECSIADEQSAGTIHYLIIYNMERNYTCCLHWKICLQTK